MYDEAAALPAPIPLLAEVPPDVRATFTPRQLAALAQATRASATRHAVDYRVSVPLLPGLRFYLVLLAGRERRTRERLAAEGQTRPWRMAALAAVAALLLGAGIAVTRTIADALSSVVIAVGSSPRNPIIFIRLSPDALPEE